MASSRLAHSDENRFALPHEADSDQVHALVAAVDLSTENLLELLSSQRLECLVAALALKSLLGQTVEQGYRARAIVAGHRSEEGAYHVLRTGRWLLRAAEAERSNQEASQEANQEAGRERASQVPEQDGANSSSSAAETNSSLHQNDARECPLRTHWS